MEFNTSEYRFSHGKEPRGTGSWAFSTVKAPVAGVNEIFWFNGSYGDAKKAARKYFKGFGATYMVYVQP
jgi:hypothetical protein